jgi:hypothetical protein
MAAALEAIIHKKANVKKAQQVFDEVKARK